ncbi:MAG: hypothetical protein PHV36_14965 [Elusimicrobiales bacterium]|nr:hypothetical protein [Elusimicrobiales bacterium]
MKTTIILTALMAVTAGVFVFGRPHYDRPADFRDAPADSDRFDTSIPVFAKDSGNIPEAGVAVPGEKAFRQVKAAASVKITEAELRGTKFSSFPKDGLKEADLIINGDGSWTFKSTFTSGKLSGSAFKIMERMQLWGDKEGQIAVFGDRGGPVMRLTAELRGKIESQLGVKVPGDYVMTFFYGSIGDGEVIYLFGGKK